MQEGDPGEEKEREWGGGCWCVEIKRERVKETHKATQERVDNDITDLKNERRKICLSLASSHLLVK